MLRYIKLVIIGIALGLAFLATGVVLERLQQDIETAVGIR